MLQLIHVFSEFIVALTVSQFVLSSLAQVTKSLQAKTCNLGDAYQSMTHTKECIKSARGDGSWQKVWSRISRVAESINFTLIKRRTITVQPHRANAAHNDEPSDYYRINVFYPFIYHVIGELKTRFLKAWQLLCSDPLLKYTCSSLMHPGTAT